MPVKSTKAQDSTNAIERLYITMRHLFNRGFYKPMGVSGEALRSALLQLSPEIYGAINDEDTSELHGLKYVIDRLPIGIEECRYINFTSDEGYRSSHFKPIIPPKRRRNCYRIDKEQMNIEITRGRSDIYDVLTHLTFLFIESHKICDTVLLNEYGDTTRDWQRLEQAVFKEEALTIEEKEQTLFHVASIIGRTFEETRQAYIVFSLEDYPDRFLNIIYWQGKLAMNEVIEHKKRTITFSPILRDQVGHHVHGEKWARHIKEVLTENNLIQKPIHIISANMHSVMNSLFANTALDNTVAIDDEMEIFELLSASDNKHFRRQVEEFAQSGGMIPIKDNSGANIDVQIFNTAAIDFSKTSFTFEPKNGEKPIILVMDYAFGEQAYETIDELLKPFNENFLDVKSISIMGKAGILDGDKGDIMIPKAHVFEGTADNYPFFNELSIDDFEDATNQVKVSEGTMITVLGTSLQNRDLLQFFHDSTWNVIGIEMEGAHYQKAIQAASKIRCSVSEDVKVRYAYYASDNPLKTGSTLASGELGKVGVKPTYLITRKIIEQILNN